MYLADTLSRHHLASTTSANDEEVQAHQLSNTVDLSENDKLGDINQLLASEATLIQFHKLQTTNS